MCRNPNNPSGRCPKIFLLVSPIQKAFNQSTERFCSIGQRSKMALRVNSGIDDLVELVSDSIQNPTTDVYV